MSKASYPLKLPASLKNAAQALAKEDGVSLNQWIAVAIAEKVGAVRSASDFLKQRAGGTVPSELIKILDTAPDREPDPADRRRSSEPPA